MALLIEDADTEADFRRLAELRKVSVAEAARAAVKEALLRDRRSLPVEERMAKIWGALAAIPDTDVKLNKKFYDDLWGEDELRVGEE